ncbi:hypothetical protein CYY_009238 [Polysphondylium violaceum]|uniref:Methyltransferase domain-containing protein n=1 Tax=Polysphondylium violaceum TaxID=133409 RepID=A0A8J4PKC6_9MYCE|nr:hypothetical protein CYY_009238 [Polysphondylium violaceum]
MIPRIHNQLPLSSLNTINYFSTTNDCQQDTNTTTTTNDNSYIAPSTNDEFEIEFPSLSEIYNSGLYSRFNNTCSINGGNSIGSRVQNERIVREKQRRQQQQQQKEMEQQQDSIRKSNISPELEQEENEILNAYNNEVLNKHGWKKRDLLYYCFIQKNHENDRIANFIHSVSLYYKTSRECLLDIGSGIGRMFSYWISLKWELIEAHEPDFDYYSFSNDYAKNLSDKIFVYQSGFLDLNVVAKYDMVVSIHGPLQYLTDVRDRFKALQNIYNSLKPGGVVLLDVSNFLSGLTNLCTQMNQQKMMVNGVTVKRISNIQVNTLLGLWQTDDVFFSVLENRKYSTLDDDFNDNDNDDQEDDNDINNQYNDNDEYDNFQQQQQQEQHQQQQSDKVDMDNSSFDIEKNDSGIIAEQHTFSILTLSELQLLLMSTGFINIKHASKWDFSSFISHDQELDSNGHRIIITGQKPFS